MTISDFTSLAKEYEFGVRVIGGVAHVTMADDPSAYVWKTNPSKLTRQQASEEFQVLRIQILHLRPSH
jgi:hypothetical protein